MNLTEKQKAIIKAKKWAQKSHYWWSLLYWRTRRGERLDFLTRNYLKAIYEDKSQEIVLKKAAQMGASEWASSKSFYVADKMNGNTLYTFPAEKQVGEHVRGRVDPVVEASSYVTKLVSRGDRTGGIKTSDSVGMKRVGKAYIYYRGAQNPRQITSIDADQVVVDEYDRYGAVSLEMLRKRTGASKLKLFAALSTPTIVGDGIDAAFEETTQQYYAITCQTCKKQQELTYWDNVDETAEEIVCKHCKKRLTSKAMNSGEWIAKNPGADVQGYHISSLYSPTLDIKSLINAANSYNETKLQEFYNQDLGLAYESKSSTIKSSELNACQRDYSLPYTGECKGVFAGVDIGKPSYMTIWKKNPETEAPRLIGAFKLNDFETEFDYYMQQFNISIVVLDALPEVNMVDRVIRRYPGRAFKCYYGYNKSVDGTYLKWYDGSVEAHRTASLDEMYGLFRSQGIELPGQAKYIPGLYEQLQNPRRIRQNIRNRDEFVYDEGSKPDHWAHSSNYALIALDRLPKRITDDDVKATRTPYMSKSNADTGTGGGDAIFGNIMKKEL